MSIFSHLFQFPRLFINLALTVASGVLQGLGLAFFIPVINLMTPENKESGGQLFKMIEEALLFIGLPYTQNVLLLAVTILIGTSLVLTFFQQYSLYHSMVAFISESRERIISNYFAASWPHLAGLSSGQTVNKLLAECQRAGTGLVQLVMATTEILMVVVFLSFGLMLSWKLLVFTIIIGVVGFLVLNPVRKRSIIAGQNQVKSERAYMSQAVDFLVSAKLIKALGSQRQALGLINGLQAQLGDAVMAKIVSSSATEMISQMIPLFALTSIIYIGSAHLELESGTILIFVVYLVRMAPLMARFQQRYQSYLIERPTINALEASVELLATNREDGLSSGKAFDVLRDRITFKDVSYIFPSSEEPTIKKLSFEVAKGSMIAFVGSSGGGKSTILELLSGLRRPSAGHIYVDGTDLNDLNMTTWRKRIGYVGQDSIIFNDTLKNNLIFAHPDASEETIAAALTTAHLDEVITGLPDGMDTLLGESGVRFSGGQRQRLALARALIGSPELLILDEATSALDADSEQMIKSAIDSISHTISVVVVAHRLSTIRNAETIHVIEHGQIIESGTYYELLGSGGRLDALHKFQLE